MRLRVRFVGELGSLRFVVPWIGFTYMPGERALCAIRVACRVRKFGINAGSRVCWIFQDLRCWTAKLEVVVGAIIIGESPDVAVGTAKNWTTAGSSTHEL